MTKILYFHGLGSVGYGDKSRMLVDAFGESNVIYPDLPLSPSRTIKIITDIIMGRNEKIVFVGTSLGGFWANYFAHLTSQECVLVNPLLDPAQAFFSRIGSTIINYVTGEATEMTSEIVEDFKWAKNVIKIPLNPKLINLFLAKDDNVIPYEGTLKLLSDSKSITITELGGHRYAGDEYWGQVVSKIKEI